MRTGIDPDKVRDLNRRFHDEVEASGYDQRMGIRHDDEAMARMVAELERVLGGSLPGGVVLDVGTGTGHVAIKLARTGRFERVVAADISAGMLEQARAGAAEAGVKIETVETDMVRLPFEDGTFDLVVGCAVLHHLPDPAAFLVEVRRVLKPGAPCVFIGEPTIWGNRLVELFKLPLVLLNRVYKKLAGKPRFTWEHDQIDVHTFSSRDIRAITAGFEGLRMVPEGFSEAIVDGSLLTLVREFLGRVPGVMPLVGATRASLRWFDGVLLGRIVPYDLRADMKFRAHRPAS